MKNRYGVEYTFVKYDDKFYRFNMSEEGMKYSRYGGKVKIKKESTLTILVSLIRVAVRLLSLVVKSTGMRFTMAEESTPLTVKRIMDRGAEGLFVEVE
jgi:hypothetical protein